MLQANSLSSSSAPPASTTDRATLRLVRVRMSSGSRHGQLATALPCPHYYQTYPEEVGPMGNVEVHDIAELQRWMLVGRPVSRAEAEAKGGCITYVPQKAPQGSHSSNGKPSTGSQEAYYLCITDTDDDVYGRSYYLPHPPRRTRAKQCIVMDDSSVSSGCLNRNGSSSSSSSSSSESTMDGCSDAEATSVASPQGSC